MVKLYIFKGYFEILTSYQRQVFKILLHFLEVLSLGAHKFCIVV